MDTAKGKIWVYLQFDMTNVKNVLQRVAIVKKFYCYAKCFTFIKNQDIMKTKISVSLSLFVCLSVLLISLTSTDEEIDYSIFSQHPPLPIGFYLQKLESPRENGDNLIVRVEYYQEEDMPNRLPVFKNGSMQFELRDDGSLPDLVPGDGIYAAYKYENLNELISDIEARYQEIENKGGVYHFDGHSGIFLKPNEIPPFDLSGFNNFQQVQVYQPLLDVNLCNNVIVKQNSLFITDLDVVEHKSRTFEMAHDPDGNGAIPPRYDDGNWEGAWTFGTLIKNMANEPVTGISAKNFIRNWLDIWRQELKVGSFANGNTLNIDPYNNVIGRVDILEFVIWPWITRANINNIPLPTAETYDWLNNWKDYWDDMDEEQLLKYAPFKLMAIVNRLDLRSNISYSNGNIPNAGETRFIFTLINPVTGMPPVHDNINGPTFNCNASGAIDWVGMNVILEYGNPFTTECEMKLFAQQWYDLSALTPGQASGFNDQLEMITNQVTNANAGGTKNFNRSAINQIRTNEKILSSLFVPSGGASCSIWSDPNWELRQFELGDDGYLEQVVLTNTPVDDQDSYNLLELEFSLNEADNITLSINSLGIPSPILDWIYGQAGNSINRIRASLGNHNFPEMYLGGVAQLYKEFTHYFGLNWNDLPVQVYDENTYDIDTESPDMLAKKIRHQVSLNTCQGCHGGETKTNFTQMYPRGYRQTANYWDPIPDVVSESPLVYAGQTIGLGTTNDERFAFVELNVGKTFDHTYPTNAPHAKNNDEVELTTNQSNQVLSPFLTGRRYSTETVNNWQDDELDDLQNGEGSVGAPNSPINKADDFMNGLYYVNDPSNKSTTISGNSNLHSGKGGVFPQIHDKKWGFNDLQRRQKDLCAFIQGGCGSPKLLSTLNSIAFIPLPLQGH